MRLFKIRRGKPENLTFLFSATNLPFHFHMQRTLDLQDKSCHTAPNLYNSRQRETKAARLWFRESNNERDEASSPPGTEKRDEEEERGEWKKNTLTVPYVIRPDSTVNSSVYFVTSAQALFTPLCVK